MATKPKSRRVARKRGGFLKDAFVPHKGNGRHPHVLRKEVILGALALVLIIEAGFLAQTFIFSRGVSMTASVLPAAITDLTNQQRADNDLSALETNALLTRAAQDKADDMAAKGYFSHISPSGQLPWYWFGQVGYNYQFAGENLAINFSDSSDVVNAWMNSPMHRANILKQEYTQIGVGIAQGSYQGQETTFVVQFFGTPEGGAPAPVAKANAPAKPSPAPVAATNPNVPLETSAPEGAATPASPSGEILGTQSQAAPIVQAPSQLPWYEKVIASPRTYATYFLLALAALFAVLLLFAFVPRTLRLSEHLPHPDALFNTGALVAVVMGILLVNQNLLSTLQVTPADSQHASAVSAIR